MSPNWGIFARTSKSRKSLASTKNVTGFDVVATSGFVTSYQVISDRRVNVRSTGRCPNDPRFSPIPRRRAGARGGAQAKGVAYQKPAEGLLDAAAARGIEGTQSLASPAPPVAHPVTEKAGEAIAIVSPVALLDTVATN